MSTRLRFQESGVEVQGAYNVQQVPWHASIVVLLRLLYVAAADVWVARLLLLLS